MSCNCEPRKYEISMGCCQPVLGPIENYYTKYEVDKLIESATTSGCCITPEEVDEKIDEAISGITVSGVTQEELDEAIASAKTQIEAEIPTVPTSNTAFTNDAGYLTEHQSLSGYATEQWVEDKHYITGVDLSNYATKSEIPVVPTNVSAFNNDAGYLTEHQSLSGYVTNVEMSAFTYDKATIDEKVAQGGTFDPTQYYTKTATNALLDEKLDVTAYTPTDLSNYYNKQEVNNIVESAKTEVESEIPTVPTNVSAFNNDAGYLTQHQSLSAYSTTNEVNSAITQATSGLQPTLSAGTGIDITNNVISCTVTGGGEDISACTFHYVGNCPKNTYSYSLTGDTPFSAVKFNAVNTGNLNYSVDFKDKQYYNIISFTFNGESKTWTKNSGDVPYTANGDTVIVESSTVKYVACYGLEFDVYIKYCEEIETAFTNHADNLSIHITPTERETWNNKANTSDVYLKSETSGATEIQTALSGKQDTLSAGTGISISGNVISATGGGGESCTVDEKVIVKPFQMTSYANLDAVYVCYSGQTYGQYANVAISGISSWFYNNLNFSTGEYTGSTSGWEDYYTITWDSANARFLFAAKGNYKIQTISGYALYYQVPLYTISGTPCDAAVELADALGDTITNVEKELDNKADYTALYSYVSKSQIWCGTQSEYDAISPKDPETLYLIHS